MSHSPPNAAVSLRCERYLGWQGYRVRRGKLDLIVTPEMGGRLMRLAWDGIDLAFTQPEFHGFRLDSEPESDLRALKRRLGFRLYGGDKTWLAPQDRWTDAVPFLDLDSGTYSLQVDSDSPELVQLTLTSPVDRETGIQLSRTLRVAAHEPGFALTHRLRNHSPRPAEWGIWDVFQCRKPGRAFLPRRPDSLFPDGLKTFTHEGESVRLRPEVTRPLGPAVVEVRCERPAAFKFGVDADQGWLLGVHQVDHGRLIAYRTRFPVSPGQTYGHGCTAEVYNSDRYPYWELEIHAPVSRLAPAAEAVLTEQRLLFDLPSWPSDDRSVLEWLAFVPEESVA